MYLLKQLPDIKVDKVRFQQFKTGSRREFDKCVASIKSHYGTGSTTYKEQIEWEKEFIPANDDVDEYIQQYV